ncbi:DUF4129 domain-containing protein [Crateriforma conspicua]|uniref:DUF4129 domain-containing protein n=1 Tax=Crateriforma conspicua TaxID=2527996 RepID=UPI0011883D57|nr:DUF4129 domain-containing protein [Crateriforma conspicua]QDV63810.1 hypothetical protein Mal65_29570 [Crateriforma conspicua]
MKPWLVILALLWGIGMAQGTATVWGPAVAVADDPLLRDTAWFDAETQTLRPVDVESDDQDTVNRNSRWLPDAQKIKQASSTTPTTTTGNGTASQVVGWVLITVFFVLVILAVLYALKNSEARWAVGNQSKQPRLHDDFVQQRIKELPAELQHAGSDPLTAADRFRLAGQYDRAIVMLYGHQLLFLDRHGLLRLSRGKTNKRYVREAAAHSPEVSDSLRRTVEAFERSYFGRHSIRRDEFETLWADNQTLEQSVNQMGASAA